MSPGTPLDGGLSDGGDAGPALLPDGGTDAGPGAAPDGGLPDSGGGQPDSGIAPDAGPADAGVVPDAGPLPDAGTIVCTTGATQSCVTACGSTGTQTCAANAWGACVPPAETCNLMDDDCSGYCDDILGCRVGVDRSVDSTNGVHFYSTSDGEAECCGYKIEQFDYYYLYDTAQTGLVPFYRCRTASSTHLYTTDSACEGNTLEGQIGWIGTSSVCGSVPLYGLYSASNDDFLYTMSMAEVTSAQSDGYVLQGTAGYVWPASCGGPDCVWPNPVQEVGSTLATVTGFPTAWYGFPIEAGAQTLNTISGTLSVTNAQNLYSEVLFILQYLPSGTCTAGQLPSSTPEYGLPGAVGVANFIVKAPAAGTYTLPINLTIPGGLPISSCLLAGLNGGPVASPQNVTSAIDLTLGYDATASSQSIFGAGGEFCFGMSGGCQASTTDDSQSFAHVSSSFTTPTQLIALYGDISDSTFDGTSSFGPLPAGAWTATNDFYIYHGSECAAVGAASDGIAGPGDYYASIPSDATHLLSVPLSGSGLGVSTQQVFQPFTNVSFAAGDCLVTLWGLQGGGAFDNETQIVALVAP